MRKRDENGKYVEFVQELAPANDERFYPVVHLKSWHEAKEEELARKRHKRATKVIEKRVEFGWSVDGSDLGHRLRRMQDFLKKGAKVEVAIGSRRLKGWRDKKEVDDEQAIALVNKVRKSAFEIEGTKETLSLQGKILDEVLFTFKGPKPGKEPMTEDSKAEAEPGRNIEDNATG